MGTPGRDVALDVARARAEQALFVHGAPTVTLDRYVLLERIGAGSMGVVYAAYDPKLARRVALKLLPFDGSSPERRRRLLREAQALARLSHPNVVPVYDAGALEGVGENALHLRTTSDDDGIAFIAMELVSGTTLRQWIAEGPRPWRSVVAVFEQAGRGLAAAHAAGIVHRDFKPDNVMLGDDAERRVRVMDFGLARALSDGDSAGPTRRVEDVDAEHPSLTSPGALIGTPAYMAPEQLAGEVPTPSVDQYAFCASFFEALHGERPFVGATATALADAKQRGLERDGPRTLPRWLNALLRRGLSSRASDRFPSMDVLLRELSRRPRMRRRVMFAGSAVIGVGLAAWGGAALQGPAARSCATAEERRDELWPATRRDELAAAIASAELPFADQAIEDASRELDAYAHAWAEQGASACRATHEELAQSAEMLDLRMACLAQGRSDFEAVVEVLAHANADVLARVREIVAGLRKPTACADAVALTADVAPPDDLDARARVEAARGELARARALRIANRHDDALAIVEDVAASVHDIDYPPLETDIAVARGTLLDRVGRVGPAEQETRHALRLALEHGQWTQALAAVEELVRALGMRARTDEALAFLEVGWGLLQRRGFGAEDEARLRASHSSVLLEAARFDEAQAELRRAIELTIEAHGPDSPEEADRRTSLAGVLFRSNGYVEAAEESTKAIAILTSVFGPEHPRLVAALNNLANALWLQGDFAGAEARAREALRIAHDAFGDDHIDVALAEATMGVVLTQAGKLGDAEPHLRRSLAIRLEHLGADDPQVGRTHNSLAVMLTRSGRHAEAEEHLREVVRSDVARLGPDHPHLVRIRYTLASALLHQGKTAEARREYELAAQLAARSAGTETRDVDHGETVLFDLLIAEGALADAEALARRRRDAQAGNPEQYAIRSKALALVLMARERRVEAADVLELAVASLAAHRPPEDAALVQLRIDLGIAASEIGEWQRAYESYSIAYATQIRTSFPPHLQAVLVFELARALDHLHREPERARALAEEALALWRPHSDEVAAAEIALIEDWLARHPARVRARRQR